MKLSKDFMYAAGKDLYYGLGKYAVVSNTAAIGIMGAGIAYSVAINDAWLAVLTCGGMWGAIRQRSGARDVAAESREYFRQKAVQPSAAPEGP